MIRRYDSLFQNAHVSLELLPWDLLSNEYGYETDSSSNKNLSYKQFDLILTHSCRKITLLLWSIR